MTRLTRARVLSSVVGLLALLVGSGCMHPPVATTDSAWTVVCNEDHKEGEAGARALEICVREGVSWGLMLIETNQRFPFTFEGPADDPVVYEAMRRATRPRTASNRRARSLNLSLPPEETGC